MQVLLKHLSLLKTRLKYLQTRKLWVVEWLFDIADEIERKISSDYY